MKKLIALVLAGCLCASMAVFAEEEMDLSGYTDEQLVALKHQVDTELVNRNHTDLEPLPLGTYVVGVDIAAGPYIFYHADKTLQANVFIFDSEEDYKVLKASSKICALADGPGYGSLEEGKIIKVDNILYIEPATASWMP